jgi:glycosyltransferase involved in cell wall biosynthesis
MRPVVFVDEAHPAWRHQWAELPAAALGRRAIACDRVPAPAAYRAAPWAPGSIVVAMFGTAGLVLRHAHAEDRVVVVLPDDVWGAPAALGAELGCTPDQWAAVVTTATEQVRLADVVAAGSAPLAAIARPLNARVLELRYAAPPVSEWPALVPGRAAGARIGWVGARGGREADFAEVRAAFERLHGEQPSTRFVFWGEAPSWAPADAEIHPHAFLTMPEYYRRLAALELDVAVAPIAPTRYNDARSPSKFLEAAVGAGCPLVASAFGPYRRLADAGAPIVTVASREAWYETLTSLLADPIRRAELTAIARAWIARHATIDAVAEDWIRVLEAAA